MIPHEPFFAFTKKKDKRNNYDNVMLVMLMICVQTFEICSSLEAEKAVQHHGLQEEGCLAPLLSEVGSFQSWLTQLTSAIPSAGERCSRQSCVLVKCNKYCWYGWLIWFTNDKCSQASMVPTVLEFVAAVFGLYQGQRMLYLHDGLWSKPLALNKCLFLVQSV